MAQRLNLTGEVTHDQDSFGGDHRGRLFLNNGNCLVTNMLTSHLDYDVYCGKVYDELLNFDKDAFHEAYEFGVYKNLNIFDALEVAQAGHLIGLDPWQAGTGYLGMFSNMLQLLEDKGYEICPALQPYLYAGAAVDWLIGPVVKVLVYDPMYYYFKVGTNKPRVRVKAQL